MIDFIKKNIFIGLVFIATLFIGFLTFLTFIDKSFISLTEKNLQNLLIINIIFLLLFFIMIFVEVKNSIRKDINVSGSFANRKYITFFSLFTLIPSLLISIFSLFLFSFALEKYFDKKITSAVNNSYELAKNYVDEVRNKIESDIVLISIDLNKNIETFYNNPKLFQRFLNTQRLIRGVDEIHLVDSSGNIINTTIEDKNNYNPPSKEALEMVFTDERPLKIINTYENKSAALYRLTNYIDTYLYVVKFLDQEISNYLIEAEEALNFYYIVEDRRTGIRISFILIYVVIVSLLLFLSISIAIRFSSRFFTSISNLISASSKIGKGKLNTKVPFIKTDKDLEILNENFNLMIDRLKDQQEKLILNERHEAWESIARKLAHEIKNPLTPMLLTIDRIKNKYSENLDKNDKEKFNEYLKTINKQINQIEHLINEFSDFARMPKPIFKDNNIVEILKENIKLMKQIDKETKIFFIFKKDKFKL